MRVRLGISTCFAVKRWPRPADWIPIVRDELGLTLIQHSFDLFRAGATATQAHELRAMIAGEGLELHSTFTGLAAYSSNLLLDPDPAGRADAEGWYASAIDWTGALGAVATGGHVGAFSVAEWVDPVRGGQAWLRLRAALERLSARARRVGLEYLMVENMAVAREPSTMEMVRDLLTEGDPSHVPIRLCLDVGHMCVPGTSGPDRDPLAWARTLGSKAPVVHLQQSDEDGDQHWPFTPARNAIGRIEADSLLDALEASGATDPVLILEVIPPFEQDDEELLDDMRASVAYWVEALGRRRLGIPP